MPEGHTVHRLANGFNAQFAGKRVQASSPQGRFADGAAQLDGRVLLAAEAHGKQMFLAFSGDLWLRVHLGLYGMWRFAGTGLQGIGRRTRKAAADSPFPPVPADAVRLRLLAKAHVADLSGPTACAVISTEEKLAAMARLGEDPLRPDADPARAYAKLYASRTSLALLLMRQDIIAGIGNIYRAELLFRARLEPHRPGRSLSDEVWAALWDDLAKLLRDGVRTGRIVTTSRRTALARPARRGEAMPCMWRIVPGSHVACAAARYCRSCSAVENSTGAQHVRRDRVRDIGQGTTALVEGWPDRFDRHLLDGRSDCCVRELHARYFWRFSGCVQHLAFTATGERGVARERSFAQSG